MGKVLKFKPHSANETKNCPITPLSKTFLTDQEIIDIALNCDEFIFSRYDESSDSYLKLTADDVADIKDIDDLFYKISSDNYKEYSFNFNKKSEKSDFLKDFMEVFNNDKSLRRVRDDLLLCADELFTNFKKTAKDEKMMSVKIQYDENNVLLSCEDSFGSLDPKSMLENIKRCFDIGIKSAIKKDAGEGIGAGIGSFLMFKLSLGLAIVVEENVLTKIAIWMPRLEHHEDRLEKSKEIFLSFKRGA